MAPIHTAAENGNLNRIRTLLNQGVNVNLRNNENMTPLMYAASGGHANVIRFLLSKGANAKARTNWNRNALIFAAEKGNANAVRALLRHSNLSVQNENGRSALTTAANRRHPEIVRMLVRAGARPNTLTHEYLTTINNYPMRNVLGNMMIRRAIVKRAVPRMREATASRRRRNLAMRQQLGSVMIREGNRNVKGLPPAARNLIGLMMRGKYKPKKNNNK